VSEWQLQETAPRDGEPFLAADINRGTWLDVLWFDKDMNGDAFPWTNGCERDLFCDTDFTHWMPLPGPPEVTL